MPWMHNNCEGKLYVTTSFDCEINKNGELNIQEAIETADYYIICDYCDLEVNFHTLSHINKIGTWRD